MSKWCSIMAVVLAVICLPAMLLSLEADAQSTVDESTSCSSSASDDVLSIVKMIASNQQNLQKTAQDVKKLLVSNPIERDGADSSKQTLVSALRCRLSIGLFVLPLC